MQAFTSSVARAERRAQSATKMTSEILHGTFSVAYLATHTIAGGNSDKAMMEPEIVQGVIGKVKMCVQLILLLFLNLCIIEHRVANIWF